VAVSASCSGVGRFPAYESFDGGNGRLGCRSIDCEYCKTEFLAVTPLFGGDVGSVVLCIWVDFGVVVPRLKKKQRQSSVFGNVLASRDAFQGCSNTTAPEFEGNDVFHVSPAGCSSSK